MSLFTTADRDAVKTAMVELAVSGFATVTVGGQTVTVKALDELRRMLDMINADLASDQDHFGLRMVTLIPPEAG
jgi:hypothetical protein